MLEKQRCLPLFFQYEETPNGRQRMRSIKQPELLNDLKVRRQLAESIPVLDERIKLCNDFLDNDVFYNPKKIELELPANYRGGKSPNLWLPDDIDPEEWANADYITNPAPMENPSETNSGRIVRSKSEAIVGSVAEAVPLLHRYEQQIVIHGEVFYPDYIFLLPFTRRLIYYEHFGKMDDLDYVKKTTHKLEVYPYYGLYLGYNFFATFETRNSAFSYPGAKQVIQRILAQDIKY